MNPLNGALYSGPGEDPLAYNDLNKLRKEQLIAQTRLASSTSDKERNYIKARLSFIEGKLATVQASRNNRSALYKKFLGGEGVGVPTRQDSIAVKNDSRRMEQQYRDLGYAESTKNFPAPGLERTYDEIANRKGITQVIRDGQRRAEILDPEQYGWREGGYARQYDAANGVVNLDVKPLAIHPKIAPTKYKQFMGQAGQYKNDGVLIPSYADMPIKGLERYDRPEMRGQSISPRDAVTRTAAPIAKVTPVVNRAQAPVAATAPRLLYTPKPKPTTRLDVPQEYRTTQDNTRVGVDFNTKANTTNRTRYIPTLLK
jgi:hypothetical protein